MLNLFKILMLCVVALMFQACAMNPNGESAGEYLDSSTTTTKVKATLVDALGTNGFAVKVKTYKDEVQLSGFVDNARIKAHAGSVASRVEGVRSVRNDIIVKS